MRLRFWHWPLILWPLWWKNLNLISNFFFTNQAKENGLSRSQNRSRNILGQFWHEKMTWLRFWLLPLTFSLNSEKKSKIYLKFLIPWLFRQKQDSWSRSKNRSCIMLVKFLHGKMMQLWFWFSWPNGEKIENWYKNFDVFIIQAKVEGLEPETGPKLHHFGGVPT
jgi:hypothetical protein